MNQMWDVFKTSYYNLILSCVQDSLLAFKYVSWIYVIWYRHTYLYLFYLLPSLTGILSSDFQVNQWYLVVDEVLLEEGEYQDVNDVFSSN